MYPPNKFARYNMFNHHFFDDEGRTNTLAFLSSADGNPVIVTDPPFGGMVEALGKSFRDLSQMWMDAKTNSTDTTADS